jgi:hypothetical protein
MPFKLAHESTALAKRPVSFRPIELRNVVGLPSDRASIARPEHPAIQYATTPTTDVVAELNRKLSDGSARLDFGTQGYLQSALDLLNIDISSQMVVFSKTSVQAHLISPNNPRALYFNDAVTLGYIRNAPFLELAAVDPKQGIVFYKLDQKDSATPQFVRDNVCLSCHLSRNTMDVPGLRLRSVVTGPTGRTFDYVGDFQMDQRTPFKEKWGGWYVTGSIKSATHLGNVLFVDAEKSESLNTAESVTLTTLTDRFDVKAYPAASSDVAALMVYEHQAHMTNLLVRIGWDTRVAIHQGLQNVDSELYMQFLANNAREAVDYMLFVDEPRLPGKVATSSTFAKEFSEKGPRDKKGRSLKQLDLATRLLRYPCSYLIYDPIFESLPLEAKAALYHRMWEILSGKVNDRKYEHLSHSDRRNIIDILRDTKSDLPEYFR